MALINEHFLELEDSYLFSTVNKKVAAFGEAHPEKKIIRMGIGDVTLPLAPAVIDALHQAVDEMATKEGFHGYGPEQGYDLLRGAVRDYYQPHGVELAADAIFISDGAKSDIGNITDLFDGANTVMIPDPVYPVYVDTNIMDGRTILYLSATPENDFLPMPDGRHADLVYLCSPNNPTGAVYTREQLKAWVDYALENEAVLLFDAAYESFITDEKLPHSIYEVDGAKECAIEFCSLSKTAGFTGTRCGYTVVPKALYGKTAAGEKVQPNRLRLRRQTTKFNGVPYIIQRGAAAVFTPEGRAQCLNMIAYYRENAKLMADVLTRKGIYFTGGINSPYIWMECPGKMGSWEFFDFLLEKAAVVGTPGAGFGVNGEGFFRLTAFGNHENAEEAMARLEELL